MSAANHLNPNQMFLFATGDEIMKQVDGSVDAANLGVEMDELWDRKAREAVDWDYPDKFSREGVQTPVTIEHSGIDDAFIMGQGHHRVATSKILGDQGTPLFLPVVYDPDFNYSDSRAYKSDYPFGEHGDYHDIAKNNPPGKWAGLTRRQIERNWFDTPTD